MGVVPICINTDGAHNPVTSRRLQRGDILSLNTFPMISGYYTALNGHCLSQMLTMHPWLYGTQMSPPMNLDQPVETRHVLREVTHQINAFFEDRGLLQYRTFGYGHSFGVLSHYYGREAGLELREDIDTVLEPGMVISMEPMLTIPEGQAGAGDANTFWSSPKTAMKTSRATSWPRVNALFSNGCSFYAIPETHPDFLCVADIQMMIDPRALVRLRNLHRRSFRLHLRRPLGARCRNNDDAICITHHDITRKHGNIFASDGAIDFNRLIVG